MVGARPRTAQASCKSWKDSDIDVRRDERRSISGIARGFAPRSYLILWQLNPGVRPTLPWGPSMSKAISVGILGWCCSNCAPADAQPVRGFHSGHGSGDGSLLWHGLSAWSPPTRGRQVDYGCAIEREVVAVIAARTIFRRPLARWISMHWPTQRTERGADAYETAERGRSCFLHFPALSCASALAASSVKKILIQGRLSWSSRTQSPRLSSTGRWSRRL